MHVDAEEIVGQILSIVTIIVQKYSDTNTLL